MKKYPSREELNQDPKNRQTAEAIRQFLVDKGKISPEQRVTTNYRIMFDMGTEEMTVIIVGDGGSSLPNFDGFTRKDRDDLLYRILNAGGYDGNELYELSFYTRDGEKAAQIPQEVQTPIKSTKREIDRWKHALDLLDEI